MTESCGLPEDKHGRGAVLRSISYSSHIFRYARARYAHRTCGSKGGKSFRQIFLFGLFSRFILFLDNFISTDGYNKNQIFR